jgi:hypothetical protein
MAPPWSTLPFVEAHVQARSRTSSGSRRSPLRPARQQLGQTPEDQELNDHSNHSEPSPRTLPTDHRDKHVTSGLGGDRLDHPPLTHRLNDQAAPAPIGHQQAAAAPDPKALHRNLAEGTPTGQLEVPPAVSGKVVAVKRPDNPPAIGRLEPLPHRGVASLSLPQDIRLPARRGRGRQDGRWGGVWGARPARIAAPLPQSSSDLLAAGLLVATGQPPPRPAPRRSPGWRPGTRPRTGGPRVAWAAPPLRSLLRSSCRYLPTCPPEHRQPENHELTANTGRPPICWSDATVG